jgi:hypothetical protein
VDALNPAYCSVAGVLFDKNQRTLMLYPAGRAGAYAISNSVTSIGDYGFVSCIHLTSVTIPDSVTNIGSYAFEDCVSLTNVSFGNSVTRIGDYAFDSCGGLTSVTFPSSVTNIGLYAFEDCNGLTGAYFRGNVPGGGLFVFGADPATVYYLPGTTGWDEYFQYHPTALWTPQVQTGDAGFGVRTNRFGFNITWTSGRVVVVEVCTNLANPAWTPLQTNTLSGDSLAFSDPQWANLTRRFYRLRSP